MIVHTGSKSTNILPIHTLHSKNIFVSLHHIAQGGIPYLGEAASSLPGFSLRSSISLPGKEAPIAADERSA
jgi:hypothetical protein